VSVHTEPRPRWQPSLIAAKRSRGAQSFSAKLRAANESKPVRSPCGVRIGIALFQQQPIFALAGKPHQGKFTAQALSFQTKRQPTIGDDLHSHSSAISQTNSYIPQARCQSLADRMMKSRNLFGEELGSFARMRLTATLSCNLARNIDAPKVAPRRDQPLTAFQAVGSTKNSGATRTGKLRERLPDWRWDRMRAVASALFGPFGKLLQRLLQLG